MSRRSSLQASLSETSVSPDKLLTARLHPDIHVVSVASTSSSTVAGNYSSPSDHSEHEDTDENAENRGCQAQIRFSRPAMTCSKLHDCFQFDPPPSRGLLSSLKRKFKRSSALTCAQSYFPILEWLPNYKFQQDFMADIVAGFTVAVMHIPQGMAYGLLASAPAIFGLYTAFFPVLMYILTGTSRHASFGTFAVVSIMVSKAITDNTDSISSDSSSALQQSNNGSYFMQNTSTPEEIVSTLSFLTGIFQLLFCILHLGILVPILSPSMVSGFTTGAAVHVFTSQIRGVFGINIPRMTEPFKIVKFYIALFSRLPETNLTALGLALSFVILLVTYDLLLKARLTRLLRGIAFPVQLLCVVVGALISYLLQLENEPYNVTVVGNVPTGLPYPKLPSFRLFPVLAKDAFVIAVVSYVVSYSIAQLYAQKHRYKIYPGQEFLALGLSNLFGACFSSLPVAGSLSRSAVQENSGGKTLVTSAVSVFMLLWVLLFAGPLFEPLPNAVLSAIIIASLRSMFLTLKELPSLMERSSSDAGVFILTFVATVVLDVDVGLLIGVAANLGLLLSAAVFPTVEIVKETRYKDLVLNEDLFHDVLDSKHCLILRISGSLNFSNALRVEEKIKAEVDTALDNTSDLRYLILDLSAAINIDPTACTGLMNLSRTLKLKSVKPIIVGLKGSLWLKLESVGLFSSIPRNAFFPTIQDALVCVQEDIKKSN